MFLIYFENIQYYIVVTLLHGQSKKWKSKFSADVK